MYIVSQKSTRDLNLPLPVLLVLTQKQLLRLVLLLLLILLLLILLLPLVTTEQQQQQHHNNNNDNNQIRFSLKVVSTRGLKLARRPRMEIQWPGNEPRNVCKLVLWCAP